MIVTDCRIVFMTGHLADGVGLFGAPAAVPSQRGFGRHIEIRRRGTDKGGAR